MKVLSLFSGIGAFEKALKNIGVNFELVNYCEIDKYASKSYCAIHNVLEDKNLIDVTKINPYLLPNDIDLITHGSPCFRKGEMVNTKNGFKKIEDIKIGDYVLDYQNNFKRVIGTTKSISQNLCDVYSSAIHCINTTLNHPFYVLQDDNLKWCRVDNFNKNTYLAIPINHMNNEPIVNNKLPIKNNTFWYLIGRYIGDGWVKRRKERANNISGIVISCGKHKIEKFKEKIGNIFNYNIIEERTAYKIHFYNRQLGEFCKLFGCGAINKEIPQNILNLNVKYLKSLLDGILDSDGCFSEGYYKISSISKKLVYSIGSLVLKVYKVPYRIYKTKKDKKYIIENRVVNQNDLYEIRYRLDNYNKNIYKITNDYYFCKIRKIIKMENENDIVYNLEVEDTHSYLINNVAVHNCQDFSLAGLQAGGDKGSNTRSSLMWNTVDIVKVTKPKYVVWENVKNLLSDKHKHNFEAYLDVMLKLGYNSYYKVLNAKDYGIPQNRERVFTISIRQDIDEGNFSFPNKKELKLKLKDILEDEVDEKYYLSNQIVVKESFFTPTQAKMFTKEGNVKRYINSNIVDEFKEGQCADISFPIGYNKGPRVHDICPALNTTTTQSSFVVKTPLKRGYAVEIKKESLNTDGIDVLGNYSKSNYNATQIVGKNGIAPTVRENHGQVTAVVVKNFELKTKYKKLIDTIEKNNFTIGEVKHMDLYNKTLTDNCGTLTDPKHNNNCVYDGVRIRKFTPKECFRLMGFSDDDFEKAKSAHISDNQLYKQAGNSIVVNVLEEIFREIFL